MFGIQMGLSLVPLQLTGCLAEGLNKEIWIPEIIEKFYPETSFVSTRVISACGPITST